MSERMPEPHRSFPVNDFITSRELGFDLEVLQGETGPHKLILSSRIQKLGLTLAGFPGYTHPSRLQIFGGSEYNFLRAMSQESRAEAVARLGGHGICCILVTKNLEIPEGMLALCIREKIPLVRTAALSSVAISKVVEYLDERLAPRMVVHGVLMDVFGVGILLLGPSGIGKSECALELILKGHRLVADDAVIIRRKGTDGLVGSGGPVLKHHMEIRGLGIIDIKELLGISATGGAQNINLAIRLEKWRPEEDYDRLGLGGEATEFLGASVPVIQMPVAPGRNVAVLVEVAARMHLLRIHGYALSDEITGSETPEKNHNP